MRIAITDMVLIAFFAAFMAICAWISIPAGEISFTLQTFGIFICFLIIGGRNCTLAVLVYMLLGLVGAPVFSNFKAGPGVLLGATGGYIIGFFFSALFLWMMEIVINKTGLNKFFTKYKPVKYVYLAVALVIALIICYAFGTVWFVNVYASKNGKAISVAKALSLCVTPFVVFDLLKIAMALIISVPVNMGVAKIKR